MKTAKQNGTLIVLLLPFGSGIRGFRAYARSWERSSRRCQNQLNTPSSQRRIACLATF